MINKVISHIINILVYIFVSFFLCMCFSFIHGLSVGTNIWIFELFIISAVCLFTYIIWLKKCIIRTSLSLFITVVIATFILTKMETGWGFHINKSLSYNIGYFFILFLAIIFLVRSILAQRKR